MGCCKSIELNKMRGYVARATRKESKNEENNRSVQDQNNEDPETSYQIESDRNEEEISQSTEEVKVDIEEREQESQNTKEVKVDIEEREQESQNTKEVKVDIEEEREEIEMVTTDEGFQLV